MFGVDAVYFSPGISSTIELILLNRSIIVAIFST